MGVIDHMDFLGFPGKVHKRLEWISYSKKMAPTAQERRHGLPQLTWTVGDCGFLADALIMVRRSRHKSYGFSRIEHSSR